MSRLGHHRRTGVPDSRERRPLRTGRQGLDTDVLRQRLRQASTVPLIPGRITRKKGVCDLAAAAIAA